MDVDDSRADTDEHALAAGADAPGLPHPFPASAQESVISTYRAIVIGCGGLGSAALYRLALELGPGVLGLEQFALGHHRGASQDHSRIIRLAQHQDQYAALAAAAYKAWEEIEAESDQRIVTPTPGSGR